MKAILIIFLFIVNSCVIYSQVNPADFGVNLDGTGASVNGKYFQNAINSAHASGKNILIPPGVILLQDSLIVPTGMTITGSGVMSTMLRWNSSYSGAGFSGSGYSLEKMYLWSDGNGAAAARCNGGSFNASFIQAYKWSSALQLNNCNGVFVKNCKVQGLSTSLSGIQISGNSTNINIVASHFKLGKDGILFMGNVTGVNVSLTSCISYDFGIRFSPTTYSSNILIDGVDISGSNISSVVFNNVKNAEVRNAYGVVSNYTGTIPYGTFHVTGVESDNIVFNCVQINNNNEGTSSRGLYIDQGKNIQINYFSSANSAIPIKVSANVENITIKGVIRREDVNPSNILYSIDDPSKVNILGFDYTK